MQDQIIIKVVGYIVSIVGGLLVVCGGLASYIFTRHTKDSDTQFANNRDDHIKIFDKLDELSK